jgi:hypothetical protein
MSEMNQVLRDGLKTLSKGDTVVFTRYVKKILPLDGFIFWVKASLLVGEVAPFTQTYLASVHTSVNSDMRPTENPDINNVIFTAVDDIVQNFNDVDTQTLWVGSLDGLRFSFNKQGRFYKEAGLYHYMGDAIYPINDNMLIDDIDDLDLTNAVVSNSMPLWLALDEVVTLYNAYLVPTNKRPPYAVINVKNSEALTLTPLKTHRNERYQLCKDTIEITLYGARNNLVSDFIEVINQYSLNLEEIGIMNQPIAKDLQIPQAEINVITMAKKIDLEINYYQSRIKDETRNLILSAFADVCAQTGYDFEAFWDGYLTLWDSGTATWDKTFETTCNH